MKQYVKYAQLFLTRLEQKWFLSVGLIILTGAALRLLTLPHLSLYSDEVWTVRFSMSPVSYIMSHLETGLSMHLYILFTKVWMQFFSASALALKAPSLVAGILTMPVLYILTKRFLDHQVALLTLLLAAFSPFLIEFSRYARVYAILTLFTLFIVLLYQRAIQQKQTKYFIWLGIANGIALMCSGVAAYMLLVQGCSMLIETLLRPGKRDWKLLRAFCGSFVLSIILASLFYSAILIQIPFLLLFWSGGIREWQLEIFIDVFQRFHPYVTPVMFILIIGGCWVALKQYQMIGRLLVLWAFVPILFFFLLGVRHTEWAVSRFLILILPAHYALISLGLLYISRRVVPNQPTMAAVGVLGIFISGTWLFSPSHSLHPILTEPHGSAVAATRLSEVVQSDDILTIDPEHLQWVLHNHSNTLYMPLNELVSGRTETPYTYPGQGRLMIVTFNNPAALAIWSEHFSTDVISGPHYTNELIILTSPKLTNEADLRQALLTYFTGSLSGIDREPGYLALPGRLYNRLAWTHHSLGLLKWKQQNQQTEEVVEHQQLADQYWELGREQSSIKR